MRTALVLLTVVLAGGCSTQHTVRVGKVTMQLADHEVVVTDCDRAAVPAPKTHSPAQPGVVRWAPCTDADITIRGTVVEVNGKTYGPLRPGETIRLDHHQLSIGGQPAVEWSVTR